jgi:hypothetical protein
MLRRIVRIDLHDLAIIYVCAESPLYRFDVGAQGIGRNLHSVPHPTGHVLNERISRYMIALSAQERRDYLRLGINRAERPYIAHLWVVVYPYVPLFFADEPPQLIKLQVVAIQVLHLGVKQDFAALTDLHA